ncbi:response regulator [Halobacteriovorax sp. GB3]|uniref:response regulator n=1 Tax=Halobacteriovorax sp. GB3 TaxID=2719615 RepID=UPI002362DABE|nr:response regulator [Halobacteriovorax sp. GB3]MDD0854087.1 response regulator [Halobacteriovorax sp. GB3]
MENVVAIIDDEEDILTIYQVMLGTTATKLGIRIETFLSAKEFINYLSSNYDKFVTLIILSDINMPEMDGFSLLQYMNENYPQFKIIMQSAYTDESYISKALEKGASDYLTKPIDFNALKVRLEEEFRHENHS